MGREIKRVPRGYRSNVPGQKPPKGSSWQVWETVSDGSPISAAFRRKEQVINWVAKNERCSLVAAAAFVEQGWAPSMIGTGYGVFTGVQMAAGLAEHANFLAGPDCHKAGTRVKHWSTGITGHIVHAIPQQAVKGTDERYYLVEWDRGLPFLLNAGEDPSLPMRSAVRDPDGFELMAEVA